MRPFAACLVLACAAWAQLDSNADRIVESAQQAVIWRAPGNLGMENWTCGSAGCDHAPAPPFQFVKEDLEGTFPKLTVKDSKGRTWSVKFGGKVTSECFGSRFATAVGYLAEPSYFVEGGKVEGAGHLRRARHIVHPDGTFERARFQLRDEKRMEFLKNRAWSLADNPFRGTHEYAGLRVLMMLLSNWDAKDSRDGQGEANTGVFRVAGAQPEMEYSFFDWGSTLGRWGKLMRRTRSDCSGYGADTPKLITGVHGNVVEWGYEGKHEEDVRSGITVEDLQWLTPYLERITDEQIRAGLKGSGATERQTACWAQSIEARMREIRAVAEGNHTVAKSAGVIGR
jgi:hypothetical protein